jgi:hypothetical protein
MRIIHFDFTFFILAQHLESIIIKLQIMKKFIIPIIFVTLLFSRCTFDPAPVADFSMNSNPSEPFEVIHFYNHSYDASQYFWDFGDGYSSTDFEPDHYYENEGTYTVTLTAKDQKGTSDFSRVSVDIYYTQLEVTVAEWNSELIASNYIPNAEVTLYATYNDWLNLRHPIETRITNSEGIAFFPHVEPTIYFIDVYHAYYDNEIIGQDNVSYIETVPLNKALVNTFTAWVDFYAPSIPHRSNDMRVPYKLINERRAVKNTDISK